jgi:hypothetical protein
MVSDLNLLINWASQDENFKQWLIIAAQALVEGNQALLA